MKKYIKRKLNSRGTTLCDICNTPHFLVEHHIRGRKINNPNHISNICNICSNCHYEVHKGIKIIEQWINSTSGLILLWHYSNEESLTNDDAKVHLF